MLVKETKLSGVLEITPNKFGDHRGFFSETYNRRSWSEAGLNFDFVQDNHSKSSQAGTLRGLHFQAPPAAQDKLVRVVCGAILDVAVDVRKGSETYGEWIAVELTAESGTQVFVPQGFLHGFVTLTNDTEVFYKCTDFYAPECDGSVRFDDPTLNIDWGIAADKITLSEKDRSAQSFDEFDTPFVYED